MYAEPETSKTNSETCLGSPFRGSWTSSPHTSKQNDLYQTQRNDWTSLCRCERKAWYALDNFKTIKSIFERSCFFIHFYELFLVEYMKGNLDVEWKNGYLISPIRFPSLSSLKWLWPWSCWCPIWNPLPIHFHLNWSNLLHIHLNIFFSHFTCYDFHYLPVWIYENGCR